MEKRKVDIFPVKSVKSIWDLIAVLILVSALAIAVLGIAVFDSRTIAAVGVLAGLSGFILIKSRNALPEARLTYMWVFIPVVLGVSISIFSMGNLMPAIFGAGIAVFMGWWQTSRRYPASYQTAFSAFRSGEQVQALTLINQTLDQHPAHSDSYLLRSVIHLALFRYREAEQDARKVLELSPGNYMGLANLGTALMEQQRFTEARQVFSTALELAPQFAINHYHVGLASYRLDDFQEAIKHFRIALANGLPPDSHLFGNFYLGNSLLQVGDADQANLAFRALKKYAPHFAGIVARYENAPDYPAVIVCRRELEGIRTHLN